MASSEPGKRANPGLYGGMPPARGPAGLAPRLLEFADELRTEGVAVGTSELLDAFQALDAVSWTSPEDFREALAATLAKSQEDRHVLDVLFDRFFFRAVEREAIEQGLREERFQGGEELDLEALRERIREAIRAGSDGEMRDLARLAIAAFGRQGEGSGVIGVDVQRIRRTLGLKGEKQGAELPDPDSVPRDRLQEFERHVRRELERQMIERTQSLPPAKPLRELDRALPTNPAQDLSQVHKTVAQLKKRLTSQGRENRGRRRSWQVDVRRTMRASLQTGGVPLDLKYRPRRPRRPELYVLCDVSTSVTSASVFFLSVLHALHDQFRKLRSFVFVERISEVTEVFERERSFEAVSRRIATDAGRPRSPLNRDRPGRCPHQRSRAACPGVRPRGRPRRAHLLDQPRAAALLELRRFRDVRLRALLRRRVRVLDHEAARGVRERDSRTASRGLDRLARQARGARVSGLR